MAPTEGLGSLGGHLFHPPRATDRLDQSRSVSASGHAVVTLRFAKASCDSQPDSGHTMTLSGTLVVIDGGAARQASVSFEDLSLAGRSRSSAQTR
jgi:hypothetical protein